MKKYDFLPFLCGLCCCTLGLTAQAGDKKPAVIGKAALSKETAILKDGSVIKATDALKRERVGEVYRLWLTIDATDCHDSSFSRKPPAEIERRIGGTAAFEGYGSLLINDVVRWRSSRDSAGNHSIMALSGLSDHLHVDPRRKGFIINRDLEFLVGDRYSKPKPEAVYEVTYTKAFPLTGKLRLALKLYDRDEPSRQSVPPAYWSYLDTKDDLICDIKADVDLTKLGEGDGHYYWFWKGTDDNGEAVGTELFLHVEHVRSEYESTQNGPPKPHLDPKIADPKFPGGVRGPGPIIVKPQFKKTALAK